MKHATLSDVTNRRPFQHTANLSWKSRHLTPAKRAPSKPLHVDNLPPELLAVIFAAGQDVPILHGCSRRLPFAVLVSHVCGRWRSVALSMSQLWSRCAVVSRPGGHLPLSLFSACLTRSRQQPLDVTIELRAPSGQVDPDDEILGCMDLLAPHAARWKKLSVDIEYEAAFAALIWVLRCTSPLTLEMLDIRFDDGGDEADVVLERGPLFAAGAPKLKHLALMGVGMPWCATWPIPALTSLELLSAREDLIPTFDEFREMLLNSPSLRRLTLGYDPIGIPSVEDPYSTVNLPSLQVLVCSSCSWPTINVISAPGLISLHIEGLSLSGFRLFAERVSTSSCYPRLQSLGLFHTSPDVESTMRIIRSLPTVTTLDLSRADNDPKSVISILLAMTRAYYVSPDLESPPWPRLKTLQVSDACKIALFDFVLARYQAALPLYVLQVSPPLFELLQTDRDGRYRWMRAYVDVELCSAKMMLNKSQPEQSQSSDTSDDETDAEDEPLNNEAVHGAPPQ
jgi:hypothetical protein